MSAPTEPTTHSAGAAEGSTFVPLLLLTVAVIGWLGVQAWALSAASP